MADPRAGSVGDPLVRRGAPLVIRPRSVPMPTDARSSATMRATFDAAEAERPEIVAALRLLIYAGARQGEIASLCWEYVQPPPFALLDSKTGPKTIYLNAPAMAMLGSFPNRTKGYVFAPPDKPNRQPRIDADWREHRQLAALPDVRLHDSSHSFASVAIMDGVSLSLIGKLLGHALPKTTAHYAHLADEAIVDAAERVWSSLVSALGLTA